MNRLTKLTVATAASLCLVTGLPSLEVRAQEKQRVSFKISAENTKYTQQHSIEVGDVSGHHVRVYEIKRTFPNNPPVINGVALKEQWTRAISDYTDNNGPGTTYGTYVLENGDKFFSRANSCRAKHRAGKAHRYHCWLHHRRHGKVLWDAGDHTNRKHCRSEGRRE